MKKLIEWFKMFFDFEEFVRNLCLGIGVVGAVMCLMVALVTKNSLVLLWLIPCIVAIAAGCAIEP